VPSVNGDLKLYQNWRFENVHFLWAFLLPKNMKKIYSSSVFSSFLQEIVRIDVPQIAEAIDPEKTEKHAFSNRRKNNNFTPPVTHKMSIYEYNPAMDAFQRP
jgi:hypothetical protein